MPAGIIHDLELVKVHVQQGVCCRLCAGMSNGTFYPMFKFTPVYQAGKRIVRCLVGQLPVLLGNTLDNIACDQCRNE